MEGPRTRYEVWVTGGKRSEGAAPTCIYQTNEEEWAREECRDRARYSTGGAVVYRLEPVPILSLPGDDAPPPGIDWERYHLEPM